MSSGTIRYHGGFTDVAGISSYGGGDIYAFATEHHGPVTHEPTAAATQVMTLQYAIDGCMHYVFDDHETLFTPGHLLIFWPDCRRRLRLEADEHWHSLAIRGDCSALPPIFALPEARRGYAIFPMTPELGAAYRELHAALCREWVAPDDAYARAVRVALTAAWCYRWRRWYDGQQSPVDPWVAAAVAAIHRHPARHYAVAELARIAGCGRTSLATRFVAEVGQPPARYAESLRMAQACRLLELSDMRIAEIAAQLGYDDHRHFGRRFLAHHGMRPSAWRRARQGD